MKKLALLLLIGLILGSCTNKNKIKFNDSVGDVQTALIKMEALIKKLPSNDDFHINYGLRGDSIVVNDSIDRSESIEIHNKNVLSVLSISERSQFMELAKYLNRNFISAGYLHSHSQLCLFVYRDDPADGFDESRDLTFLKNNNDEIIINEFNVLDKQDQLILLKPKR